MIIQLSHSCKFYRRLKSVNKSKLIRNTCIQYLKTKKEFDGAVVAEIDGRNIAAADIALPNANNHDQVYRLVIIKHIN